MDLDALRQAVGPDTAGLMLTNPNTVGLFDANILEITQIVHDAGGLCYYDGANLNAVMGHVRPGDMGFDCVHLNLHKTFSTPHGGGGPGSGPVGCKAMLEPFLPTPGCRRRRELFPVHPCPDHGPGAQLLRQLPGGGEGPGLPPHPGQGGHPRGFRRGGAQRQLPDEAAGRRV